MEALLRLPQQIGALWAQLSGRQRGFIAMAAIGVMVLVIAMTSLSTRTSLEPLYTELEPDDAAAVVERLREQNLEFQISDGGRTILAPADRILDLRLAMAADGVPAGGSVGFGIFDETSFTITDLTQRVNFQRALQGELERTIKSLQAIETARVLLVIPRQSLFLESQQPATASVALRLRGGRKLTPPQVAGIRHLVAASVEGLSPEDITIVDAGGAVMDADLASGGLGASSTQLQIQRDFERERAGAIRRIIERVIGPNRSAVSVTAVFDWTSRETTREIFEGGADGNPLSRSRQTVTETFSGPGVTPPGGVPGVTSNTSPTGDEAAGNAAATSTYSRTEVTENNELTKRIERDVASPGQVLSMRVSVLLDSSVSEEDVAAITQAVTNLINEARGDTVAVGTATFNTDLQSDAEAALTAAAEADQMANYITMGVVGAVVLVVVIFLWRTLRAIRRGIIPASVQTPQLPAGMSARAIETAYGSGSQRAADDARTRMLADEAAAAQSREPPEVRAARQVRAETHQQLAELAQKQPEAVVRLLETWLAED